MIKLKTIILFLFSCNIVCFSQDVNTGGTNSWIIHTPDDGRTSLFITPLIDNSWQWNSQTLFTNTGDVFFSGNIGIESTQLTSSLSIGTDHGVKLSVGNSSWSNSAIIETGYNYQVGDFTNIKVPGYGNNSAYLTVVQNGNVGIGTSTPDSKLAVNGTIHAKEVKVDMTGWSDFVFKKEYKLSTLEEVEKHIAENGHLENIPSEKEVLENGINLGEMNAKLLQKIEEITLYMIFQNKKIKELEQQNTRLIELEKRIEKIETNSKLKE